MTVQCSGNSAVARTVVDVGFDPVATTVDGMPALEYSTTQACGGRRRSG